MIPRSPLNQITRDRRNSRIDLVGAIVLGIFGIVWFIVRVVMT